MLICGLRLLQNHGIISSSVLIWYFLSLLCFKIIFSAELTLISSAFLQIADCLKVNDKCPDALSMLGNLELKNDDWIKAKETLRAARDATEGKDSYATLSLVRMNHDL